VNVAFLGLGTMGAPMARVLARGGHAVTGYDIDDDARRRFVAGGGVTAGTAADAVSATNLVLTMLPEGRHVREALLGPDGVGRHLRRDALVLEMSTIDPRESDAIRSDLASIGVSMVDAPVGRTSEHAARGELLVMAGGTPADLARVAPLLELVGDRTIDCGGPGTGVRMKIVNNFMSIALNALSAEALTLAEASGLDLERTLEVLTGTPAGQGHFTTTYPGKVLAGDLSPAFQLRLARKDLAIGVAFAATVGLNSRVGPAALGWYDEAMRAGRGGEDWTAIFAEARGSVHET